MLGFFEGELDLVTPHRRRYGGDVYLGELDAVTTLSFRTRPNRMD